MDKMQLKALAKINLGLDVLRRREDGYHEVRMIMQTVRIFDRLQLMKQERPGIRVRTNLYYLPANENNLVYKAAKLLFEQHAAGQLNPARIVSMFADEEQQREIILRRYFYNQTQTRIAADLGISQVQVSRLLRRTLKKIQDKIDPDGVMARQ